MNPASPTIGMLYPGELGTALAELLMEWGAVVVTTVAERSPRSVRRSEAAGIVTLPALPDVAARSDIVFSAVPPAAAITTAEAYCRAAARRPDKVLYVDLNSISPSTASRVRAVVEAAGLVYVDAAIHGLAAQLAERGTLYLSGGEAEQIARLFECRLRTRLLGDAPVAASAFKMLLGGFSKGLVAMFLELAVAGERQGVLAELVAELRRYYGGTIEALDRLVPTYPRHAARRGQELREVTRMLGQLHVDAEIVSAAAGLLDRVGRMELAGGTDEWTLEEVVREIERKVPVRDLE